MKYATLRDLSKKIFPPFHIKQGLIEYVCTTVDLRKNISKIKWDQNRRGIIVNPQFGNLFRDADFGRYVESSDDNVIAYL